MKPDNLVRECLRSFTRRQRMVFFALMLLTVFLGLIFPLLLSTDPRNVLHMSRTYRPGELSDEDVIAPYDLSYIDAAATSDEVEAAARSVLPQFSYSVSTSVDLRKTSDAFASAAADGKVASYVRAAFLTDKNGIAAELDGMDEEERRITAAIIEECTQRLVSEGIFSSSDLEVAASGGYSRGAIESSPIPFANAGKTVPFSEMITDDDIYKSVLGEIAENYPSLPSDTADIAADAVSMLLSPTVFYDPVLTTAMREDAAASVPPVLVEINEGDYILRRDTVVTEQQLRTIERIYDYSVVSVPFWKAAGYLVYVAFLTIMLSYLLFCFIKYRYRLFQYTTLLFVGIDLSLTAAFFISLYLPQEGVMYIDPFLPFLIVPAFAASITGRRRVGFAVALLLSGFAVIYPDSQQFTFFYLFLAIECCMMFIRFGNERIDLIYQTLFSALAVAALSIIVSLIYNQRYQVIFTSAITSALNVVFSFIFLSIILPVIEKIFNIPTAYRLHELSFSDTPTLNRLSQVAPGTANHSKNVSEMAYEACKAIGANADLAKVGGLYHDIGKAEHPEYFIENQNGKNAHDEINKTLSAAIIKSHVKLGVEKAKEIGLPQEVIDIISEHHGNDLIKYFYNEAIKEAKESRSSMVSEEDFRYNGHIPSSPESAVVMLSDCTEAATRTMKNPNHQKYDKFISSIIIDKMNHRQLNNSGLTINDLEKIKESFIHYLLGRDHQRIEYQKEGQDALRR